MDFKRNLTGKFHLLPSSSIPFYFVVVVYQLENLNSKQSKRNNKNFFLYPSFLFRSLENQLKRHKNIIKIEIKAQEKKAEIWILVQSWSLIQNLMNHLLAKWWLFEYIFDWIE